MGTREPKPPWAPRHNQPALCGPLANPRCQFQPSAASGPVSGLRHPQQGRVKAAPTPATHAQGRTLARCLELPLPHPSCPLLSQAALPS